MTDETALGAQEVGLVMSEIEDDAWRTELEERREVRADKLKSMKASEVNKWRELCVLAGLPFTSTPEDALRDIQQKSRARSETALQQNYGAEIASLTNLMLEWVEGKRSWHNQFSWTPETLDQCNALCAQADAAEVQKLSAAIQALAATQKQQS